MYYVYIISNWNYRVFYTGFNDDLERRIFEHREQLNEGFTKKYQSYKLLYFEEAFSVGEGLHRERQLKRYRRKWKEDLIRKMNPRWEDLYFFVKSHGSDPGSWPGNLLSLPTNK